MKTEPQVKNRLTDIDNTLAVKDPDYPSSVETEDPDIAYLRGYSDALMFVLVDTVIIERL